MSENDPLIGKQLGDYAIQEMLGKGGMASVYKGYDSQLDRYAAVKVIEPNLVSPEESEEYRERFQKEARAIARLNHPRVVGVYQFNNFDNLYYMAMVFVEGQDLRHILKEYIRQGKQLSSAQILRIIRDIADALDYSHSQEVIHRDVKPSNIMVTKDNHAVLTDFGLALNAQEGTIGNTFGSVHYIAPEQAMSSAQSVPQSDLYSLGVVLYEMLVGRVPFEDHSAMSVALKHISDPPPPPRTLNPDISPELEEVLMKILDKDPDKRYPDGKAFVYALEGAFAASADEDTHDIEESEPTATPVKEMKTSPILLPQDSATSTSKPVDTSMDDIPTISDSSRAKPGSLPFSPVEEDEKPPVTTKEDQGSRNGMIYGGIAAVVVLVLIGGAILLFGGGGNGDNGDGEDGTATAIALAAITEEASPTETTEPTDEPEPTETEMTEPTATDTVEPTATNTAEATETDTAEPTATNTPEPTATDTPEPTATNTPEPSATPTPDFTPTFSAALLTPQGEDDTDEIILRYDGRTLVVYNRSTSNINIANLVFSRDGQTFRARDWNQDLNTLASMRPTRCYQVYTLRYASWARSDPPVDICSFRQGFESTVSTFWTTRDSVIGLQFEVRNRGNLVAECPVAPWESEDELYCFVDLDAEDSE